jgi:serine/threonine protein phosphatase PrpC
MQTGELMKLEIDSLKRPSHDTSHDRLSVLRDAHRTLIALADGVDASQAAQAAAGRTVDELARCFRSGPLPDDPRDWVMMLEGIDHVMLTDPDAGETSALVILVHDGVVVGASVGNSLAYIVSPAGNKELLTKRQYGKARIGTGLAAPVGFGPTPLDGKLITRRAARFELRQAPATAASPRWSAPSQSQAHC